VPQNDRAALAALDALQAKVQAFAWTYLVEVRNRTEYAFHVQNRDGLYIFDDVHLREGVVENLRAVLDAGDLPTARQMVLALEKAGADEVAHLRSLTAVDGAMRHPGGWQDRTGQLAAGYESEARKTR